MAILTLATSDGTESNWPSGWLPNAVPINSNNNYHERVYARVALMLEAVNISTKLTCDSMTAVTVV